MRITTLFRKVPPTPQEARQNKNYLRYLVHANYFDCVPQHALNSAHYFGTISAVAHPNIFLFVHAFRLNIYFHLIASLSLCPTKSQEISSKAPDLMIHLKFRKYFNSNSNRIDLDATLRDGSAFPR